MRSQVVALRLISRRRIRLRQISLLRILDGQISRETLMRSQIVTLRLIGGRRIRLRQISLLRILDSQISRKALMRGQRRYSDIAKTDHSILNLSIRNAISRKSCRCPGQIGKPMRMPNRRKLVASSLCINLLIQIPPYLHKLLLRQRHRATLAGLYPATPVSHIHSRRQIIAHQRIPSVGRHRIRTLQQRHTAPHTLLGAAHIRRLHIAIHTQIMPHHGITLHPQVATHIRVARHTLAPIHTLIT